MQEEWGPWIEHDGRGCPVIGQVVQIVRRNGEMDGPFTAHMRGPVHMSGYANIDNWVHLPKPRDVIRYRVRKPRALIQLREMIENLPAPSRAREEA